ncbi:MAG: peptidase MA family metallohydrolase [Elusimicrobia bacterium]|nr:peptidase MA family metallohydrolase [Elusimicrobiota bacterium]
MKKFNGTMARGLAAAILLAGAQAVRAQDNSAVSTATVQLSSSSHEGAKYGHADSSVAEILKSTYTTEHFNFYFAEDKAALQDMFAALENNYARVTKSFKIHPANRLKVEIYPDIRSYHRRTFGENSQDWMVGNFDPDERVLRIASPNHPGSYHKYKDVVRAAVHEFVHSVTFEYRNWSRDGLPAWLDEGLAVYYEGPLGKNDKKRIKEAVAANKVPTISNMHENFLKYGGYTFSCTVVDFILKKYGSGKLLEFIKDPAAYERIFAMPENEFSDAWHKYLKEKYGNGRG